MTTARLKYRNYIPYGWIAIEFCDVTFFGDNASSFEREWYKIKYDKCDKCKSEINDLEKRRKSREEKRKSIMREIKCMKDNRQWWRFWRNDSEKELEKKLFEATCDIRRINSRIESIEEGMFYSTTELIRKAETFLNQSGFVLKSTSTSGSECETHTDIWKLGV